MNVKDTNHRDWANRGKTIEELIKELRSFENQGLPVEISIDGGDNVRPLSLVGKKDGKCLLIHLNK
ncbi:hypothetical protein [Rhizobium rhizogenes]|jgi:hypothetical protein|uniref:hypothetical protein n=1 Tax=Rhizobium rhizogenes TaxID=359 RepID=UPI0022CB4E8C|nr:hypothetical protein [Rhizobium rhizogenes]MCZ7462800.1 hypothetical protein [Rhizobium rhizogenes]